MKNDDFWTSNDDVRTRDDDFRTSTLGRSFSIDPLGVTLIVLSCSIACLLVFPDTVVSGKNRANPLASLDHRCESIIASED